MEMGRMENAYWLSARECCARLEKIDPYPEAKVRGAASFGRVVARARDARIKREGSVAQEHQDFIIDPKFWRTDGHTSVFSLREGTFSGRTYDGGIGGSVAFTFSRIQFDWLALSEYFDLPSEPREPNAQSDAPKETEGDAPSTEQAKISTKRTKKVFRERGMVLAEFTIWLMSLDLSEVIDLDKGDL